jgi:leucyl aminopeptidase (aminopeptidase T)
MIDLPIGRVCPERAEAYGLNFELWEKSYNSALAVDLSEIRKAGAEWAKKLRRRREAKIISSSGTNLAFETKAIEPMVDDGIVSASDVRRGFLSTTLPPGKIVAVVSPNSVRGRICFSDPVFMMGRSVRGLQLTFEKGKLVDWRAEENGELLSELLKSTGASKNRMRWFSIGLNPAAKPCMLDNSIVENDVGIGLGPHPMLERSEIGSAPYFEGTIGLVTVELSD